MCMDHGEWRMVQRGSRDMTLRPAVESKMSMIHENDRAYLSLSLHAVPSRDPLLWLEYIYSVLIERRTPLLSPLRDPHDSRLLNVGLARCAAVRCVAREYGEPFLGAPATSSIQVDQVPSSSSPSTEPHAPHPRARARCLSPPSPQSQPGPRSASGKLHTPTPEQSRRA